MTIIHTLPPVALASKIPALRTRSSVGRALPSHGRGHWFESSRVHPPGCHTTTPIMSPNPREWFPDKALGPFVLSALLLLTACKSVDSQAVQAARQVQHFVHPDRFSPKDLVPLTLFMIQEKNNPPLQRVFKTNQNLTEVAEPGAGTKVEVMGLDPDFHNTLPGGYEHRRVKLDIYQHLGEAWYPGFVDVVRKKNSQEPWRVLMQCTSERAHLNGKNELKFDPMSTNCYWSHFHHDRDWYKPVKASFRREKP